MPAFCPYFDGGSVFAQVPGTESVSGDDSSLKLLELEPTTRSTTSLCESVSTLESHEVTCCCTGLPRLLTLHRIVQQAASVCFDHCDLFSFLPFEGDLVMGKVNDSSFTLKDDSLSELYSPAQSMF